MIVLEPIGGLANRISAIRAAVFLAQRAQASLWILWEINGDLGAPMNALFELSGKKARTFSFKRRNLIGRAVRFMLKRISFYRIMNPEIREHIGKAGDLLALAQEKNLYIQSCYPFFPASGYGFLKTVPSIKEEARALTSTFDASVVGVHIRRTDNTRAIETSTTEKFIMQMRREIALEPRTRFFLSTDAPQEGEALKTIFPERILSRPRELRRDTVRGCQDALTDLLCLSKTRKILGSYGSSFSTTAADWGKLPLVIVQ